MTGVLGEILEHKRREVEHARRVRTIDELRGLTAFLRPRRNFFGAVAMPRRDRPNLIAEIKHKSPSAGVIRAPFDPAAIAREYERAGAAAISVLTDDQYFGGCAAHIEAVKTAVGLPVLRKEFIVDEYQLYESRAIGADAVLLISEALDPPMLGTLAQLALELELTVLLEVHSHEALMGVLGVIPRGGAAILLGINNRNLATQVVDIGTFESVAAHVPPTLPMVAESGIKTRQDVQRMHRAGARAMLVGESLLREPNLTEAVRILFS